MNNDKRIICHPVTNKENDSFIGIRIKNEEIHFYHPESYDLAPKDDLREFRNDIINIIRSISLAKSKSSVNDSDYNKTTKNEGFALMSYLWIIRDYFTNGYYRNTEKLYKTNAKGKVNWKKTLETQPIISKGNVIYNDIVTEVRNDCDDVVTDAHKYCVFDSVRKIGWLFGISEKSVYVPKTTASIIKKYIRAIKTELTRTFDDTKKLRLTHMLKVLSGVDDSDRTKEIVYGVDKYHYVFERMVDCVFSNITDIKKYNPNAKWYLKKNNYFPKDASSLRPDTIRIEPLSKEMIGDEKVAYILDAKYYRFGMTKDEDDLPETTSIQKQITYGDNIICNLKKKENIQEVYSAFVLPYNKNANDFNFKDNLEYIGYSEADWRNDELSHVKIYAFLIDMKHLIITWSQGNCAEDIKKLIEEIENATKNESM